LPITELQNEQTTLTGKQSELQSLGSDFTALQTALGAVDRAAGAGSLAASVSSPSVASASLGTGALAGSYSVDITSLGALANTISASTNSNTASTGTVADPTSSSLSNSSSFTLTVGTTNYTLTPASNTLDSLVTAINASGANVQAGVVNVGTSGSPSYQLAIQGTAATASTVQLNDGTQNLMGTTNTAYSTGVLAVSDPSTGNISNSSTFTLTVGGTPYSLTPASNNLDSLVTAINTSGANVQATVVNVGGSSNPNYELSIQGSQNAAEAIQLNDGTNNLLTTMTAGAPVTYSVNGQASVSSNTPTLSISTGLTVTALGTGTATVSVAQSASGVENALSSLVTSYNSALTEVNNNRGQNGGALAGDSVLLQLSNALQSLAGYTSTGSGSIQTMTDLGLSFNTNGQLQFDSSTFESAAGTSLSNVMSFLGSESANTGFLGAVNSALNSVTDSTKGAIAQETTSLGNTINNLTSTITTQQTALSLLQTNLTAQMEAADSAVAELQSQVTEITDMFSAEQVQSQSISNG
jgi:flagellar hook-associated protein 2